MLYLISLTITNIILLAGGFGMFFLGLYFNSSYHMNRLGFISQWLRILPWSLIGLGIAISVVSVLGVFSTTNRSKLGLRIYIIIVALLVLPQFFTTYVTSLLNGLNAKDNLFESNRHTLKDHIYDAKLRNDAIGNATINDWHFIESTLRCCGDIEMKGYQFWFLKLEYQHLPESCCVQKYGNNHDRCKYKDLYQSADLGRNEDNAIYRLGCLSVLDDLYLTEVKPILKPFYMILSIAIAIVEIVSVAVAAAYISNIKKRVPSVKF